MTLHFHRTASTWIGLLILVGAHAHAQLFETIVTLNPGDQSINQLTIQSAPGSSTSHLAYESTGAVLSDRIELRTSANLEFSPLSVPPDWQWQSTLLDESGTTVRVITFYYAGNDPGTSAEFFDFATPWQASFRLTDPAPGGSGTTPNTTALSVEVNGSSVIPGLGVIPVSSSYSLAASLTSPTTQVPFSFSVEGSDPSGPTLRFNTALPGVSYCIESTETLQLWSKRTNFTTGIAVTDYPLPLGGGWKLHEFFRILLIPLPPA